jgi:two-component system copper resistance phosphate regulon response regulator CusR
MMGEQKNMRILVVEDEKDILDPVVKFLQYNKYAVDGVMDGKTALEQAKVNKYDCILLDLNLPEIDGLSVAKELREEKIDTPIIILTARGSLGDKLVGFETGADDYIVKPFDFNELILRINAVIRRTSVVKKDVLKCCDIELDTINKTVKKGTEHIILGSKEYGILEYLLRNKGRFISAEELLEKVWDEQVNIFTQTVRANIKTLRKKIDKNKQIIKNERGKGYIIY